MTLIAKLSGYTFHLIISAKTTTMKNREYQIGMKYMFIQLGRTEKADQTREGGRHST